MSSRFTANDEERKIKAMLPTTMAEEVTSGKLQDLGLIGILDYTCNVIQNQPQKLDVYIHDYLVKRGLNASAKAFMQEGKVCTEPVGKKFLIQ